MFCIKSKAREQILTSTFRSARVWREPALSAVEGNLLFRGRSHNGFLLFPFGKLRVIVGMTSGIRVTTVCDYRAKSCREARPL